MNIHLKLSDERDAHIVKNLWPLYQHDVSEFDGATPNSHGLFGVDDDVSTPSQQAETLNAWWGNPKALFPYLILADGQPAGFNLIAARSQFDQAIPADFVVHEFFVLRAHRGKGVAERAVIEGFERHRGRWEVVTYPNYARGIAFWRRVVGRHSESNYTESEMDHPWGRKVVFRFDNARKDADPRAGAGE